jgi:acyl-coenzyme A synthetase/AMP-(fatty) acid ligase
MEVESALIGLPVVECAVIGQEDNAVWSSESPWCNKDYQPSDDLTHQLVSTTENCRPINARWIGM